MEDPLVDLLVDADMLRALFNRVDGGKAGRVQKADWLSLLAGDPEIQGVLKLEGHAAADMLPQTFETMPEECTFALFAAFLRHLLGMMVGLSYEYAEEIASLEAEVRAPTVPSADCAVAEVMPDPVPRAAQRRGAEAQAARGGGPARHLLALARPSIAVSRTWMRCGPDFSGLHVGQAEEVYHSHDADLKLLREDILEQVHARSTTPEPVCIRSIFRFD